MRDRGHDKGNGERKGGIGSSRRTSEGERGRVKGEGRRMERCKRRGGGQQGAGITNESSLLFSQLFFSAP